MTRYRLSAILLCFLLAAGACIADRALERNQSASATGVPTPPVAERRPHKFVTHGDVREDPYYWLMDMDKRDPDVLGYLEAENNYTEAVMSDTKELQEALYAEMKGRWPGNDQTAPQRKGGFFYYTRQVEGKQYDVHCRRKIPDGMGVPSELDDMDESISEEVLLDVNEEAKGHSEYAVMGFKVSPDHRLMMYALDTTGSENFTIHVKDLYAKDISTGKDVLSQPITGVAEYTEFASDSETIFYAAYDDLQRPKTVWRHRIGTPIGMDMRMYYEEDDPFYVGLWKTDDENFIVLFTDTGATWEEHYLDAADPEGEFRVVNERRPNVRHDSDHRSGYIYTLVDDDEERPNGEVVVAPMSDPSDRKVLFPHQNDSSIEKFRLFKNFMAVIEKRKGLSTVKVYELPKNGSAPEFLGQGKEIEFEEDYVPEFVDRQEFDSDILRITYTSLTTPLTTIDYNMATGNRSVKKVDAILGGFNASNYHAERVWATANDSTKIPISLVYKKDAVELDGTGALVLDVYGAYGSVEEPTFERNRLSFIDRGFVYAIAHVRGGGAMGGRYWWEAGKSMKKITTFTDLIACAEELVKRNYTSLDGIILRGRSAGGTTVGAAINMRPDLFKAAVLEVPFVDVLTSLSDDSQPLTATDVSEWGDPQKDKEVYFYIKSYSPVDNIEEMDYPHFFVTCGLHDRRVMYWEPAKYTAKMRSLKTDDNLLLMKCDMSGGHFYKAARFARLKNFSLEYTFYLKSMGRVG